MPPVSSPVRLNHRFNDFDAFTNALSGWQLQFDQLDRGSFRGELEQCITPQISIQRGQFNRRLEQQGANPTGCRTFGIPNIGHTPYQWRRHELASTDLLSFAGDVELQSISAPEFHIFAVSINDTLLNDAARLLGYESHSDILDREHIVSCSESKLDYLRQFLNSTLSPSNNLANGGESFVHEMESDLPLLLLQLFISQEKHPPKPTQLARRRALRNAQQAIMDSDEPISNVSDLCRLTGEGERTLRYAFMEAYGVSPKAYLHALRLNAVRRILRNHNLSPVIADVANSQGFWHMGQFAADYKKMFGELPSATLKHANSS